MRLILASTSPRRRSLLSLLGIEFEVCDPGCDEAVIPGLRPEELACHYAQRKAHGVSSKHHDAVVLGSDTLIDLEGSALGKPAHLEEAREMLRRLAGRGHAVHTAVTLSCLSRLTETTQLSTARVWMKAYDASRHEHYLATGDSLGKAGAYSIQGAGAELIERIEGDFTTIVGLPLRLVAKLLREVGVEVPADIEALYAAKPFENWASFSER
ncbi:MAG TPA: Maf family protein [Nitrospira sp.]|nr:Maf family protein [Nitrospira sp.]